MPPQGRDLRAKSTVPQAASRPSTRCMNHPIEQPKCAGSPGTGALSQKTPSTVLAARPAMQPTPVQPRNRPAQGGKGTIARPRIGVVIALSASGPADSLEPPSTGYLGWP